jgi:hypothetical protein
MAIDALPTAPSRNMASSVYILAMNAWIAALPTWTSQANVLASSMTSVAAGTAFSITYTFSTTTTDADPGAGLLRLSSATQNTTTVIRADLFSSDGTDWTSVLDSFAASSSSVKGQIRLIKLGDATKWIVFNLASTASPSGYRNLSVTVVSASSANPFTNGDTLSLSFTRNGDVGSSGTIVRRTTSITSSATPTPDSSNTDLYLITALATAPTFGVPAGTPADGQGLLIRIKDNGTARALAYNAIYRPGTDLALPSTTVVSKTLYIGFVYNSADTKWDLVGVLNNI